MMTDTKSSLHREFDAIVYNILFWTAYFLYEWLGSATIWNEYERYFINAVVIVPITCASSLFTVNYLFPRYYKRTPSLFWLSFLLSLSLVAVGRRTFTYFYTYPLYYPEGTESMSYLFFPKLLGEAASNYLITALYSLFFLGRAYYKEQRLANTFEQQKTEAELQVLKMQVQPHFIFNTLNNIYSHALQKNRNTPKLIHKLSSFLSYNLYESKMNAISLSKEIEFIRSYMELEKIRYKNNTDWSVNVFDNIDTFQITPLLLLPIVENCLTHGFTPSQSGMFWVRIDVTCDGQWAIIKIENNIQNRAPSKTKNHGIGLQNVKRRLELIYPETHHFKVSKGQDSHLCVLELKNLKIT